MVWNVDYLLSELGIDYPSEKKGELCIPMTIKGVAPIDEATPEELAFCSSEGNDAVLAISRSRAGVILCKKSVEQLQYHSEKKRTANPNLFGKSEVGCYTYYKDDPQKTKEGFNWDFAEGNNIKIG